MIFDSMKNILKYSGVSANFKTAAEFISKTDFSQLDDGRYEVDGKNVYCMVQTPALKPSDKIKWEAHRNYADIQVGIISGEACESIPLDELKDWEEYNPEWDCVYAKDQISGTYLKLDKGMFAVFFPWDGHKPCIKDGALENGKKAVIKVKI